MKAIPIRKIKNLLDELLDISETTPEFGIEFSISGVYELDKDTSLGLIGSIVLPEPLKAEVSTGVSRSTQGAGQWSLRIYKDPWEGLNG